MIAHGIINVPLTPAWQGALLMVFIVGIFFVWRGGTATVKSVFKNTNVAAAVLLVFLLTAVVLRQEQIKWITQIAIGMLVVAIVLETFDRRKSY
jgi:drug/metabolite transporter (DMT)-like permease